MAQASRPDPGSATDAVRTAGRFHVDLTLDEGYAFRLETRGPGHPDFMIDEPPPLGAGRGPSPVRVLASAMASCLGSSLLFCLRKARVNVQGLRARAEGTLIRNAEGRLRVGSVAIELLPSVAAADVPRMARCLEIFEEFCVVTGSVRRAFDVTVTVSPQRVDESAAVSPA